MKDIAVLYTLPWFSCSSFIVLFSSVSSGPLTFPVTPSTKMLSDKHWSRLMWFIGCVRNTQKTSCLPPVARVRLWTTTFFIPVSTSWLNVLSCVMFVLHRYHAGLQHEQDSQSDWGGGGSLHRQQSGHLAHHVPPGGPLPNTHTLLQHTLVRASTTEEFCHQTQSAHKKLLGWKLT